MGTTVELVVFEDAFCGRLFPRELREAKVEEDKLKGKEEFHSKRAKTTSHESGHQKTGDMNRSSFQQRSSGPAPSSANAPVPRGKMIID
ncbi:hypothetical protein MTR67_039093 [Solanum verrucosum]|uniref:Uncharacterized protein n=1 Tax=Solanum verrucosum TaxID=315347 RepID=A0AAF0ZQ32_SOLVR|nr:hypothetical protein MTR67_039093 [Solanum verrucosum]